MSFIIAVYTIEGLVIAADSRGTMTAPSAGGGNATVSFEFSDSVKKLFSTQHGVGIATCGAASINGLPIAGFIEQFTEENAKLSVDEIPQRLVDHFHGLDPTLATRFIIGGYQQDGTQRIFTAEIQSRTVVDLNPTRQQGAYWAGESDIVARLFSTCWTAGTDGTPTIQLPTHQIPFNLLSLQDAVDFATFAMNATISAIRFQARPKTVGGPIDVLVVKPRTTTWVQAKKLHT